VRRKYGPFLQRLCITLLHIGAAWFLIAFSLAYLVRWTGIVALSVVVALFVSLPILVIGVLYMIFDGYRRIPGVTWVGVSMLLLAGVFFLVGMLVR